MRITTQMVANSAQNAGIDISSQKTLGNYLSSNDNDNSIENVLNGKITSTKSNDYKKIFDSSKELKSDVAITASFADKLTDQGDNTSVLEDIKNALTAFTKNFNATKKSLKNESSTLNSFYSDSLSSIITENASALSKIGITASSDGTLSFDEAIYAKADTASIKKLLGSDSLFTEHLAYVADKINDNAQSNLNSYASGYNAEGIAISAISSFFDQTS